MLIYSRVTTRSIDLQIHPYLLLLKSLFFAYEAVVNVHIFEEVVNVFKNDYIMYNLMINKSNFLLKFSNRTHTEVATSC